MSWYTPRFQGLMLVLSGIHVASKLLNQPALAIEGLQARVHPNRATSSDGTERDV